MIDDGGAHIMVSNEAVQPPKCNHFKITSVLFIVFFDVISNRQLALATSFHTNVAIS